jgi:glyceraldehyde-3-phosphate dehydrogenase (NAD(P))
MVKVVIVGVGTIGKRVAEAVKKQEDMDLYGVADVSQTGGLRTVVSDEGPLNGVDLYASTSDGLEKLERQGFEVEGMLKDQLNEIDIAVDCTPSGVDMENKRELYKPNDVKAIFQGGASGEIADVKFNADANYEEARGEDFVKVVSCNTTSLSRTMNSLEHEFGVKDATANLVRRGGDIPQDSRGPINSIIPVTDVPSHHGPDVQEVMPELDITTLAVKVPVTYGHVHMVTVNLEREASEEEVISAFGENSRIKMFKAEEGYDSTAKIHEMMRDLHRNRSDMPEAGVWEETINVEDGKLRWIHMVQQESIVVPDSIDAIRSMFDMEDKETSIQKTNKALGIK